MAKLFNKMAEICVAVILDDRLSFVFLLQYLWNEARYFWDI